MLCSDGTNDLSLAVDSSVNKQESAGFSGVSALRSDYGWGTGGYIASAISTEDELKQSIDDLLRQMGAFYIHYAPEVAQLRRTTQEEISVEEYRQQLTQSRFDNAAQLPAASGTMGEFFDIFYGQKELHSRENLPAGDALIISPTEQYNGCYGWLSFEPLIRPPFVTVAQTGSIGEAFVQLEPCGVNDDCLVLLPKQNHSLPAECLFVAASILRLERWRFSYGRKLTPARICEFKMSRLPSLEMWAAELAKWKMITEAAVKNYEVLDKF